MILSIGKSSTFLLLLSLSAIFLPVVSAQNKKPERVSSAESQTKTSETDETVGEAIKSAGIEAQAAEVSMIPQNYIKLTGDDAKKMLKLYEAVDDNDDVQNIYANFDIDESEME